MSEKKGIESLQRAVDAILSYVEETAKVLSDGFQMTDLLQVGANQTLINKAKLAFEARKQIDEEAKDLDATEIKILTRQLVEGLARIFSAFGFQPDNKALKTLKVLPRVIAFAEHSYTEGRAIYEEIAAPAA